MLVERKISKSTHFYQEWLKTSKIKVKTWDMSEWKKWKLDVWHAESLNCEPPVLMSRRTASKFWHGTLPGTKTYRPRERCFWHSHSEIDRSADRQVGT